ncbi:PREDICTED: opticin [Hipposideros armiger]|uniref:Opticin n=1 Tax=Hipposideros armiger TaxID=186990 RepID=A0A8B7S0V2_HIPAR|nr:PREDICTED: opticin [Hipposideros armiger]
MNLPASLSLLALALQEAGPTSLPKKEKERSKEQLHREGHSDSVPHPGNYALSVDNYDEAIDLSNCEELTGCGDQVPEVSAKVIQVNLKRTDLSRNFVSSINDDALHLPPALQDLILPGSQMTALPRLPMGIEVLDIRLNQLQSSGMQPGAFRALEKPQFLYLDDNLMNSMPGSLQLSVCSFQNNMIETMHRDTFCATKKHKHTQRGLEDIRLDSKPINLGLLPSTISCLPGPPTGRFS